MGDASSVSTESYANIRTVRAFSSERLWYKDTAGLMLSLCQTRSAQARAMATADWWSLAPHVFLYQLLDATDGPPFICVRLLSNLASRS